VIPAETVKVTGSYVMLTLTDGRQVAYDVADVDTASLTQPSDETAAPSPPPEPAGLSHGKSLSLDRQPAAGSGLAITDTDVAHVRPSLQLPGDEGGAESGGQGEDQGDDEGTVRLASIGARQTDDGSWVAEGVVENSFKQPVTNVMVVLTVAGAAQSPIRVAQNLNAGATAPFSQAISVPEGVTAPQVSATIQFLRRDPSQPPTRRPEPANPRRGPQVPRPVAGPNPVPTPRV